MYRIVGSTALKQRLSDFKRDTHDIDIFVDNDECTPNFESDKKIDKYVLDPIKFKHYWDKWSIDPDTFATLDELYTIKLSHLYWNINWNKHAEDLIFMQNNGCQLDQELHDLLYHQWEVDYGKKVVNLNQEPETFFNKHVERIYDHDDLHVIMAYREGRPLYMDLLHEGKKVFMSKDKFLALKHEEQLQVIREEVMVIAIERELLPCKFKMNILVAYRRALKKTVVDLSKGWFSTCILQNLKYLWKLDSHFSFKIKNTQWKI
jgi:hypothetical protein